MNYQANTVFKCNINMNIIMQSTYLNKITLDFNYIFLEVQIKSLQSYFFLFFQIYGVKLYIYIEMISDVNISILLHCVSMGKNIDSSISQ